MSFRPITLDNNGTQSPQVSTGGFRPITVNGPRKETSAENIYGANFRYSPSDTPFISAVKTAGNLPSSAASLVKGVADVGMNPLRTILGVNKIVAGGAQKLIPGEQKYEQDFGKFTSFLKDRYGSLENLQKTSTEDPVGFATDILGIVTGGATIAGKAAQTSRALSTVARTATAPVAQTAAKAGDIVSGTTKFGVSQATGLNPETITQLVKNPEAFKAASQENRVTLAKEVASALDERLSDLSDLGKEYEVIRANPAVVQVPAETIPKVLNKYGVKLDGGGKIVTSPESRPLSPADRSALQEFIDNYGKEQTLSSNAFLNTREALSNLSKYEQGKTALPQQIARDLRSEYDQLGKSQISGLKELDSAFAPEKSLLKEVRKDIFKPSGELKDGAINRIANLTGKGKEIVLNRIKQVVPDIEQRIRIVKAVEDIENASGLKIGTYTRTGTIGAGVVGLATGNIPAIVFSIIAQPEIAVPLLKGYGLIGKKAAPVLRTLRAIVDNVDAFNIPQIVAPMNLLNEEK